MTQRSRSALFTGLSAMLDDEEAVGEMLSYFPARDGEEPATKDHIDARFAQVESRFAQMDARFAQMDAQMDARLAQMDARLAQMETRLLATFNEQMAGFNAQMRTVVQWTLGAMVALIGLVVAMGFLQSP